MASNHGYLVFLVFLVTNLRAMAPQTGSMASNLRARTSNFDCFAVSLLVTNLLAMALQPAFDGLQPKRDDLHSLVSCHQPTSDGPSSCLRQTPT